MIEIFVDVIEVQIDEPRIVRVIAKSKTVKNAVTIISMAIIRRCVGKSFYTMSPVGKYRDGDTYNT